MAVSDWIRLHLPGWRHMGGFLLWGVGRVSFSLWLFGLRGLKEGLKVGIAIINMTEGGTNRLLSVYSQLPYMGTLAPTIDTTAVTLLPGEPENIITDLVASLDGKHVLLIGDTGTGKSLIAQYLAYQIGGEVKVYDPDASPDEWVGLQVIGRGGNFAAIGESMAEDLEELQRRIEVRGEQGDRALAGLDSVLIAEEFPLLKDEVAIAADWLIKHARRGRKPKRFVIALSQDDNVVTLGIEGQGGVRKCFRMVRLGKFAVTHAKSLKDNGLVEWLKAGKYRCLVDDTPCQLPDLSSYRMIAQRLPIQPSYQPVVTAETATESGFQPVDTPQNDLPDPVKRAVKAALQMGIAESRVVKEILGFEGSRYQQGKALLQELRQEL
jgi:hypothetical protein